MHHPRRGLSYQILQIPLFSELLHEFTEVNSILDRVSVVSCKVDCLFMQKIAKVDGVNLELKVKEA